jgi:RNA polymerase sigma factor (sigma-70 family)
MEISSSPGPDWEREFSKLLPILVKFFQCRRFSDCESLAQECVLRALTKIKEGEEIKNLRAYLMEIARNLAKETWRTNARTPGRKPAAPEPKNLSERRSKALDAAKRAVLSERERKLFDLYHNDGRGRKRSENRKNLAARLGITSNALRIRMSRILTRLQRVLQGEDSGNTQES